MTAIARRVRSTPVRTGTETWALIVELIAATDDTFRAALKAVGNAASMVISEEHTVTDPIVLSGCGPQIRIYTLHGSAAIDGAGANEAPLTITRGEAWQLSLPASGADLDLAGAALAGSAHIDVYDPSISTSIATTHHTMSSRRAPVVVDLSALEN